MEQEYPQDLSQSLCKAWGSEEGAGKLGGNEGEGQPYLRGPNTATEHDRMGGMAASTPD